VLPAILEAINASGMMLNIKCTMEHLTQEKMEWLRAISLARIFMYSEYKF